MFGKSKKVLTYTPQEFENPVNSNPLEVKNIKSVRNKFPDFFMGWAEKLESFSFEILNNLLKTETIQGNETHKRIINNVLGIKPVNKLLILLCCIVAIFFNPALIVFIFLLTIYIINFYNVTMDTERKNKEKKNMKSYNENEKL